ncbi:EthD domain-containing protein [Amycolatopsis pithecellobii]|uniref:Ethyl tert-butyl ether degradation protein EthD n=1 Tax=Amycolatopsis pithecellobii TaxID=664692 RepID=A0A6N7Z3S4_9PSEU|nr:EthD domain-containing protein [Amycolatopsis pithecellobii]MTD54941.1 ethyl tert-butyl ether degradation protein EthD [Amycolatopsis pithecellobii]
MIKVVGLFKKKDGISAEEFRDYYENHHGPLFNEYLKLPGVKRYTRRYLRPIAPPITGEVRHSGFDVIMEVWCDEHWYKSFFVDQPPAEFRAMIAEDEAKLFDRDQMSMYTVDECDTDLSTL